MGSELQGGGKWLDIFRVNNVPTAFKANARTWSLRPMILNIMKRLTVELFLLLVLAPLYSNSEECQISQLSHGFTP